MQSNVSQPCLQAHVCLFSLGANNLLSNDLLKLVGSTSPWPHYSIGLYQFSRARRALYPNAIEYTFRKILCGWQSLLVGKMRCSHIHCGLAASWPISGRPARVRHWSIMRLLVIDALFARVISANNWMDHWRQKCKPQWQDPLNNTSHNFPHKTVLHMTLIITLNIATIDSVTIMLLWPSQFG